MALRVAAKTSYPPGRVQARPALSLICQEITLLGWFHSLLSFKYSVLMPVGNFTRKYLMGQVSV
jgi:hypothetical protein